MNQAQTVKTPFSAYTPALLAALTGIRRGIEKEGIRTTGNGALSSLPHPLALGSALMHPYITTDFAEAQLELITPAETDKKRTFEFLTALHHVVAKNLPDGEVMWGASFPPRLPADDEIAIAEYGHSNAGQLKMLYRQGLANRYGRRMQTVSGIHYNFSLPMAFWQSLHQQENSEQPLSEFVSSRYFHLIRNVLRHGWVIPYLFGVSPAIDQSYLIGREHHLEALDDETFYLPWATSLRLSQLGYGSSEQSQHPISYNDKDEYLAGLYRLLTLQSDGYVGLDEKQQVNKAVLQLENELYGSIRPKIVSEELRPLYAMCRQGVEYVELRSVDNNPYLPVGISEAQSHFLDVFLTACALMPSPELHDEELAVIQQRQERVAVMGRQPELLLPTLEGEQPLRDLGLSLLSSMEALAQGFDEVFETTDYQASLVAEQQKFIDSELTPSAQLLADLRRQRKSYRKFVLQLSNQHNSHHKTAHQTASVNALDVALLTSQVSTSLMIQQQKEAEETISFDAFLREKNTLSCTCE